MGCPVGVSRGPGECCCAGVTGASTCPRAQAFLNPTLPRASPLPIQVGEPAQIVCDDVMVLAARAGHNDHALVIGQLRDALGGSSPTDLAGANRVRLREVSSPGLASLNMDSSAPLKKAPPPTGYTWEGPPSESPAPRAGPAAESSILGMGPPQSPAPRHGPSLIQSHHPDGLVPGEHLASGRPRPREDPTP